MLHDPKKQAQVEEEIFHANLKEWQNILLRAAGIIKQHGWCRDEYENTSGQRCAWGGMFPAAGHPIPTLDSEWPVKEENPDLYKAADRLDEFLGMSVIAWNDGSCLPDHAAAAGDEVVYTMQLVALG